MRAYLDRVLDGRLDLCCGLFGAGARHVSKRDERLAVLRGEIEPIGVTVPTPSTLTGAMSPTFHMGLLPAGLTFRQPYGVTLRARPVTTL